MLRKENFQDKYKEYYYSTKILKIRINESIHFVPKFFRWKMYTFLLLNLSIGLPIVKDIVKLYGRTYKR
jgi:hypothetical protein